MVAGAYGKEIIVEVNGKPAKLQYLAINHEIKENDIDKGSQESAMACSLLFYSLLSKGDVQAAAKLSSDPKATAEEWMNYQQRVGADNFKKEMREYFKTKNVVVGELVLAEDTMLVVKTEDGERAQFYQKKNGKYFMTDKPTAGETLGKVLNMIQEGKIKL
jgi:hypothetical protein